MVQIIKRGRRTYGLLIRVLLLICAIRVGLHLMSFPAVQRVVDSLSKSKTSRNTPFGVKDLSWAVSGISRFVPRATCLTQALALHILLRRRRLESIIHIGVAKNEGEPLESHAWVESGGRVVIGNVNLPRFTPMTVLR